MRINIPPDLLSESVREAYRRGWTDRAQKAASRAGSVTSEAKAKASRLNGAKGGRPRLAETASS